MNIKVELMTGGYCTHSEHMVFRKGSREQIAFPSLFALIKHPDAGYILFDTGYSQHFHQATQHFPYSVYAKVTPVFLEPHESALEQLQHKGISGEDIRYIFISHFHGDHVSALKDFPKAEFICLKHGYEFVSKLSGIKATRQGFLPQTLPSDFESRVQFIDWKKGLYRVAPVYPFEYTFDFFEDGSILCVPLDGHFPGQMGLLIPSAHLFLVADACWLTKNYRELVYPHPIAMQIMNSASQYKKDIQHIAEFAIKHPKINIVPSHCTDAIQRFQSLPVSS